MISMTKISLGALAHPVDTGSGVMGVSGGAGFDRAARQRWFDQPVLAVQKAVVAAGTVMPIPFYTIDNTTGLSATRQRSP